MLISVASSRRVPWARIITVDHLGGVSDSASATTIASTLVAAIRRTKRVMRARVRVIEKQDVRRQLIVDALRAQGFLESRETRGYTHTHILGLNQPDDVLFRNVSASARRAIQEPLKRGLALSTCAGIGDVQRLLNLMEAAFARTGAALDQALAQRDLELAIELRDRRPLVTLERGDVRGPDRIVAFAMGLHNGDHVTYHHGAAERGGELASLSLSYAPLWELVRWARARDVAWFDFGGITVSDDPRHPQAGIAKFKRRFGGSDARVATEMEWIVRGADVAIERTIGSVLGR